MSAAKFSVTLIALMSSMPALAWSGFDYENSTFVDIDKGSLVRRGKEIDIYDYSRGYIPVEIEHIHDRGYSVELEVREVDTGKTRTLDMDEN